MARPDDSATIIAYAPTRPTPATQPTPTITQTGYLTLGSVTVTAITRRWAGDDAGRCTLCPAAQCRVYRGCCTVQVSRHVSLDEAELFSAHGLAVCPPPPGPGGLGVVG